MCPVQMKRRAFQCVVLALVAWLTSSTASVAEPAAKQNPARAGQPLKLFLLIGQSNMAGRAAVEEEDRTAHPRVFKFTQEGDWVPGIEPLHFDKPATVGVGPGSAFARVMADRNPDARIGLIPCAVGATPLERWVKGGDLFQATVLRTKLAMSDGELNGILWHQGEADSRDAASAQTYAIRLSQMVRDLRAELKTPQVPFVAGKLGKFLAEVESQKKVVHWRVINSQLDMLPMLVEHTGVVESDGLTHMGDSVHFDTASQRLLGRRYAEAMELLRGVQHKQGESSSLVTPLQNRRD